MKSLMLKDLYNIKHNSRQMLLVLVFLAVCMIPSGGPEGMAVTSAVVFGMMTVTTFSFDERCKWEKYALIMPVSARDYVMGKFLMNLVFGLTGVAAGTVIGGAAGMFMHGLDPVMLLGCMIAGILFNLLSGSLFIPLLIRFGSENARMIMLATVALPFLGAFGIYKLMAFRHIVLTQQMIITILIAAAVLVVVVLPVISYGISVRWFKKREY